MLTPEQIQQLIQLPVQALLVIAVFTLWKAYIAAQNARVNDLKQIYGKNLTDINNRVMMIEDRLGIKPPLMDDAVIPGANLN